MKKNTQSSIDMKIPTKKTTQNYYDFFAFKQKPISTAALHKMIADGIEWAKKDERAYKVGTFFRNLGYCTDDVTRWCERDEEFAKGYKLMKEIIGDRREIGALEKRLSEGIVAKTMHRYDSEWIEVDKHHALLKQKEEDRPQQIVVVMEPAQNSGKVPDRVDRFARE